MRKKRHGCRNVGIGRLSQVVALKKLRLSIFEPFPPLAVCCENLLVYPPLRLVLFVKVGKKVFGGAEVRSRDLRILLRLKCVARNFKVQNYKLICETYTGNWASQL